MPLPSKIAAALVAVALLFAGVAATGTRLFFQWPAAAVMGSVAVLATLLAVRHIRTDLFRLTLWSFVALSAYVVIRALASPVAYLGRQDIVLITLAAAGYGIGGWVLFRPTERLVLMGGLGVLVLGNAVAALWQLKVDPTFTVYGYFGYNRPAEANALGGLYVLHNHLAGFLEMMTPLAIALLVIGHRRRKIFKAFLAVVIVTAFIAMALSRSRGGTIGLPVGLTVTAGIFIYLGRVFFAYHFPRLLIGAVILIAIIAGPLVWFSGQQLAERFQGGDRFAHRDTRFGLWEAAWGQFESAPWVGTGSRSYGYLVHRYWPERLVHEQREPLWAHNDYVQLLAEYGLIGGVLMLFFLLVHGMAGCRYLADYRNRVYPASYRWQSDQLAIIVGSLGGMSAMLVHSVVDFNMHSAFNLLVMSLLMGFLASPTSLQRRTMVESWWRRVVMSGLMVVPGVWLVWACLKYFPAEIQMEKAGNARRNGSRMEAVAHLQATIESDPDRFDVYSELGGIQLDYSQKAGMPQPVMVSFARKAVEAFDRSLAIHPLQYQVWLLKGHAWIMQRDFDKAESCYLRALGMAPKRGECHLNLGRFYYIKGRYREAVGKPGEALAAYEKAIEELNNPFWAWENMEVSKLRAQFLKEVEAARDELTRRAN